MEMGQLNTLNLNSIKQNIINPNLRILKRKLKNKTGFESFKWTKIVVII